MSNKVASYPAAPAIGPLHRHGGRIAALSELPIHALGDDYTVDGNGTVNSLPSFPSGTTVMAKVLNAPTFVNSTKLICPNAVNYSAVSGDLLIFRSDGDGIWRLYVLAQTVARIGITGGRLTLTSGVPVTESDVTGVTTVYLTPSETDWTYIYDGANWVPRQFAQTSLILDSTGHLSGSNYDVFEYWTGSAVAIGTGPAWSSGTSRGTGAGTTELQTLNGRLTNTNAIVLRNNSVNSASIAAGKANLRGTIRITSNGITEDSATKRFVSNLYNPTPRQMIRVDTTDTWTYSTAAFRQSNGSALNQVEYVHCVAGRSVRADAMHNAGTSAGSAQIYTGIGIDSTTVDSSTRRTIGLAGGTFPNPLMYAFYNGYPGTGYHKVTWLEKGWGSDTQTWFGDAGSGLQNGIAGETLN